MFDDTVDGRTKDRPVCMVATHPGKSLNVLEFGGIGVTGWQL